MAIDKDKVLELFGRYWEIAYNEGRTGEGFPDLANDVLAELRDVLDADDGDVFTGQLVEIDGHTYGLRPGAARMVKDALRDAGRYRLIRDGDGWPAAFGSAKDPEPLRDFMLDEAIRIAEKHAAMANGGAP